MSLGGSIMFTQILLAEISHISLLNSEARNAILLEWQERRES